MRVLIFLLPLLWVAIGALDVPPLTGRVVDLAGVIESAVEERIEAKLALLEKSDTTQIVVLTVPTLDGDSIEDFSIQVVEKWKLGRKGLDNGALLVIATNDRKLRIEVGYGLEGRFTDLIAGRIIRQIIVPRFRKNDFSGGIEAGVDAMIAAVKGEFTAPEKGTAGVEQFVPLFFLLLFILMMVLRARAREGHAFSSRYSVSRSRGFGGSFGGGGFSGGGGRFGGGGTSP